MPTARIRFLLTVSVLIATAGVSLSEEESSESRKVRVAAISFVPVAFELEGNADRLEVALRKAVERGVDLAVAPEGALDGYGIHQVLDGTVSAERMRDVALEMDDPIIKRFQTLAQELDMCLVFGFAELVEDDIFNCAVFIDNQGNIRGKQHKMQFAEGYDESWWHNRLGSKCRAFDTPFGRCGILICNDRWNPELARIAALDGAQFLCIPANGSTSPKQDETVLRRSLENNIPVVEANVGVTLVVDRGKIRSVDREREAVTVDTITISPASSRSTELRDRTEQAFLRWRQAEMPKRLAARRRPAALEEE